MPANAAAHREILTNTTTLLAHNVNRTILQQALVESKLFAKNADPDEIRRISRTQSAWVTFVLSMLDNPDTRVAAFRALAILVNGYVKRSALDQRIESALRKSKHAAERGDTDRLQRELSRVRQLANELHIVELYHPDIVLLMWASSEFVRERITEVSRAQSEVSANDAPTPIIGTTTRSAETASAEAEVKVNAVKPAFIAELETLSLLRPQFEKLKWPFKEQLRNEAIPPGHVMWPSLDNFAAQFAKLNELGTKLIDLPSSSDNLAIQDITKYQVVLRAIIDEAAGVENIRLALSNLETEIRQVAVNQLATLDGSLTKEMEVASRLLVEDSSSWANAIAAVDGLVARNSQLAIEIRSRLLQVVDSIELVAADLPLEKRSIVEAKVRFLIRRKRVDELQTLLEGLKTEVRESQDTAKRVREAAAASLSMLEALTSPPSPRLVESLLGAVKLGDLVQTRALLDRARQEAEMLAASLPPVTPPTVATVHLAATAVAGVAPIPPMSAPPVSTVATTLLPHSSAEPVPTLRFDEPLQPNPRRNRLTFIGRLDGFVPRDRVSQHSQVSNDAGEMLHFLLERALQEMRRGSILGVLDHALDILMISTKDVAAGAEWTDIALALAASLPARPEAFNEWGERAVEEFAEDLRLVGTAMFPGRLTALVAQTGFSDAVAERFVHKELAPILKDIATSLYHSVRERSPHLIEDLARGVGAGVRYGDPRVSKGLLVEIAILSCCDESTVERLTKALDGMQTDQKPSVLTWAPYWLAQGILAYREGGAERKSGALKSRVRGSFNVQVPQSVQLSGGFVYTSGSDQVDLALQVGNPQALQCMAAELVVPAQRNSWLARDAVCYLGALPAKARLLAPVRLHFNHELVDTNKLDIQTELRFKDYSTNSTQAQDDKFALPFSKAASITIDDYEGASGKPIKLEGETLRLSSDSVRQALVYINHNLQRGSATALIIGRRRRGKTSILQTIAQDPGIRRDYIVVADTIEDLPFRSLSEVLGHMGNILDRVARQLNVDCEPLEPLLRTQSHLGWVTIQEWLASIDRKLVQKQRVLLLLDEFHKWFSLLEPESRTRILSILRGLNNRPQDTSLSLSVVLSGLSNIREYARTSADFLNAYRLLEVKAFTADEASALIRSNPSIEFDTRAVSRIVSLSGRNPFLINLLGNEISVRLREQGRPYCFPDDVERVVGAQLEDRQNSRVWTFLQYLLKQGEEDHASEINELPGLLALAWTLRARGAQRRTVSVQEIVDELTVLGVECDARTLAAHLNDAAQNELLVRQADRYSFASDWLAEWLAVTVGDGPAAVSAAKTQDLVLNRYRIGDLIDRGGQGAVYLAHDTLRFDTPVVLKIYARTHGNGISNISEREARALCSVQHNAVVRCYSYGTDPEVGDVLVLEYVKGITLRQLLSKPSKVDLELIGKGGKPAIQIKFIEQIANALAECHGAGVVHKDLKPENILVEHSAGMWLPKLIDFGISSAPLTTDSALPTVGPYTVGYVAPERYQGAQRKASADIYSLGVIAYELLTGVSPFSMDDPLAAAKAQQESAFRPLLEVRPQGLTARVADLVEKMMDVNPLDRPNALTLTSSLPAALQASDWRDFYRSGQRAYENGDSETAFGCFERAAFAAKESEHGSADYVELTRFLVDSARDCARIFQVSAQLVQPILRSTIKNPICSDVMAEFTELAITEPQARPADKDAQRNTVATLVDLLLSHDPAFNLSSAVRKVLAHIQNPLIWEAREAVYELGLGYRAASYLIAGSLENWCIQASRLLRERNATPDECQLWLRRAERLGVQGNAEYRAEAETVERLLRTTANARELPPLAKPNDKTSRVIGEDERSHLQAGKIERWAARLRDRHPYVAEVRRVRKDPDLALRPTRVLDISNISQHISALQGIDPIRIVPAILDESYCIPPGRTVLRVNIVLPEGTTLRQREAAMERFRKDRALFGEDS